MKYIRTADGRIVDIEKFINEEKDTPYYKDFEFEEISKDGQLNWTAVGTEKCSFKDQIGRRCHFSATLNSDIVKQADTIKELCDELVIYNPSNDGDFYRKQFVYQNRWEYMLKPKSDYQKSKGIKIYGAIWVKGEHNEPILKSVAEMNEKGELELL